MTTDRKTLRDAVLGAKPRSMIVEAFGVRLELRQPSLRDMMALQTDDGSEMLTKYLMANCYVPGTEDLVFEASDKDVLKNMPFGPDFMAVQKAVNELVGVDIDAASQEVQTDPT